MNKSFLLLAWLLFLISSCKTPEGKEKSAVPIDSHAVHTVTSGDTAIYAGASSDYIIFGRFCGECMGECATMYKFDPVNRTLFADHSDSYWKYHSDGTMKFATTISDPAVIALVQEIPDEIPDELLHAEAGEQRFGCPDCADGCGIFFEIGKGKISRKFYIDNQTDKLEGDVKAFAEYLQEVLAKI
ncbi:MAG: hypothetical protein ACTHJT_16250 [Cytophaga sp.]|uniref:hypothetical protein n=1 Tax=Cytophaga sp. TaxID=29535 RepID=UPI003F7E4357